MLSAAVFLEILLAKAAAALAKPAEQFEPRATNADIMESSRLGTNQAPISLLFVV